MKKHMNFAVVIALILVISAIIISSGTVLAATDGATVTLSVDTEAFATDQPVIVHVTIANLTNHSLKVLKWHTPADDVEGSLFAVQRDSLPVAYIGPLFKRPAPKHVDYIHLKAGESISHDVDIALYYDLSVSGSYRIIYDVSSWDLYSEKGNGKKDAEQLTSNEISAWIAGRDSGASPSEEPKVRDSGKTSFAQCTTSQQSLLVKARTDASTYTAGAQSYLQTNKDGQRYTTWFGLYDATRYGTVTTHFNSIDTAMDNAAVAFDCSCKKPYYAYVYPNQPYKIFLCKVFWTAPATGTDSKAGTLIHEMSHFNPVASTNDWVYGQTGAMTLAKTSPAKAITNADNHEYFAENTPALP